MLTTKRINKKSSTFPFFISLLKAWKLEVVRIDIRFENGRLYKFNVWQCSHPLSITHFQNNFKKQEHIFKRACFWCKERLYHCTKSTKKNSKKELTHTQIIYKSEIIEVFYIIYSSFLHHHFAHSGFLLISFFTNFKPKRDFWWVIF